MTRTEIINHLIKKNGYTSYLEIGLDSGINYSGVECLSKESVDPFFPEDHRIFDCNIGENDLPGDIKEMLTYRMTSDEFFAQNQKKYDIIFIDGLHLQSQVGKDIINGLKALNPGGIIVVHDCLPNDEIAQIVPRQQVEWNGDVWKAVCELIDQGLDIQVVDTDYGCGLVKYTGNQDLLHYPNESSRVWDDFVRHRNDLMHVITVEEFHNNY